MSNCPRCGKKMIAIITVSSSDWKDAKSKHQCKCGYETVEKKHVK